MAEFRIRVMSLQAESIGSNLVFSAGSAIIRKWWSARVTEGLVFVGGVICGRLLTQVVMHAFCN